MSVGDIDKATIVVEKFRNCVLYRVPGGIWQRDEITFAEYRPRAPEMGEGKGSHYISAFE
jgi:hypothetical protein